MHGKWRNECGVVMKGTVDTVTAYAAKKRNIRIYIVMRNSSMARAPWAAILASVAAVSLLLLFCDDMRTTNVGGCVQHARSNTEDKDSKNLLKRV